MDQALLNLKNQERQVVLEIRNAVRSLDTTFKQVQAFRVARELAEKKLAAEEERLRVGLSTNYLVLQYQRDLTSARVSELNAIINYNNAQAGLDRSTGVILEKRNIKIDDIPEMRSGKISGSFPPGRLGGRRSAPRSTFFSAPGIRRESVI